MMKAIVLLGDFDVVRNMGHRFHGKEAQLDVSDLFMGLAILLAVVAIAWVLTRFARRQDRHIRSNSPRALFMELCAAHRLDRQQRQLLLRLAKFHQLTHPAELFLEISRFEVPSLPAKLASQASRLEQLRQQLFFDPVAPADPAPAESSPASTVDFDLAASADDQPVETAAAANVDPPLPSTSEPVAV